MAIASFIKKSDTAQSEAAGLLQQGDRHLAAGSSDKALECYIQAADMGHHIPVEYARKAAQLALNIDYDQLGIENRRIAACFELLAHDAQHGDDDSFNSVLHAFQTVLDLWRSYNIAPLQHLILSGEGFKRYLLELTWNEAGTIQITPDMPSDIEVRVKRYLAQRPVYLITLDTLYGWQPFEIMPMLRTDEEIRNAFPFFARGGISYMSPRIRPMIVERFQHLGRDIDELPEFPYIKANMNWYENCGYLGNGFGQLEGLHDN